MGVPSFYRWLANKYPKIVVNAVEKSSEDGCLPNPNGIEFDNLYLDMNGIIHPCFHPENDDVNSPVTYDEVFKNVFEYIDRLVNIVRPRKLLFMAIDGVAPRAKMNQQRTRRFRNAKDHQTLRKEEDRVRRQYEMEGRAVLPNADSQLSDSNIITPGTEFMYELAKQLETYICLRIANNPAWKLLKVIFSDANAPGEGEHKIMSFIRCQRACPGYNPNTSHALYGLDADLIMLALATHEIHFSILRENVFVEDNTRTTNTSVTSLAGKFEPNVCDLNQELKDTTERMSSLEISTASKPKSLVKKPYQFLHIWTLREYLKLDLKLTNLPEKFKCDIERLIDDFIFVCFFAGNDFLPPMPTLDIHEGAMNLLIHVYKEEFKNLGGYLVDAQKVNDKKGGYIKLNRVEKFVLAVGAFEDQIFKKRSAVREKRLRRFLSDAERENEEDDWSTEAACNQQGLGTSSNVDSSCSRRSTEQDILENTKMLKEQLKSYTRKTSDVFQNGLLSDMVKFGSPGWRKRYYKNKFSAETDEDIEIKRKQLVEKYTEGLCWVLQYYFLGVPSWTWFYPYHYGPFASDLKGLSCTKVIFQKGLPFKPFDQLMAVLPPMSAHALPASYQLLMTDRESSILDFYPSDFDIDTDGKRFIWQGICKLPFIEEERLLDATKKLEKELGEDEANRNVENVDKLFVHFSEKLALQLITNFSDVDFLKKNSSFKIDISLCGYINGFIRPLKSKREGVSSGHSNDLDVLCVYYDPPCFSVNIPRVLEGTNFPETVVTESDIEETHLWHENLGYNNRYNSQVPGVRPRTGVASRPWFPDVSIRGTGNGWNPRALGKVHNQSLDSGNVARHDAIRTPNEQTAGPSRWDGYGRGTARGNGKGARYRPRFTDSNPYPARAYNMNGHFWSENTASGSSSNQAMWQRRET